MKTVKLALRMLLLLVPLCLAAQVQSADLFKLHSVGGAQFSPDGKHIAYTVSNSNLPGRPWRQVWMMEVSSGQSKHLGGPEDPSSGAKWSPDGSWIAYHGKLGEKSGLLIAHPDGTSARFLVETEGTMRRFQMWAATSVGRPIAST